jgi:hypothetical protein
VGISFGVLSSAFDNALVDLAVDVATQTITAPFVALAWTMTYYRLRGLKEPA